MVFIKEEMIKQFETLMEKVDEPLKKTFKNLHNGYQKENLVRFLKARDGNVSNAYKMLVDCLNWRIQNEIDDILSIRCSSLINSLQNTFWLNGKMCRNCSIHVVSCGPLILLFEILYHQDGVQVDRDKKPIIPSDLYRSIRDSQLTGMSGYSKEGLPVIAVGVGRSTYDKASIHYYIQSHIQMNEYRDRVILPSATQKFGRYIGTCVKILDMTGLKISALNQIKLLSVLSTIDDLNYPEKTDTYYIVNAPYIFSACWKVVRPLLQERTRQKVQVLSGSGRDELLKIMDYESLPHFCRSEGSGSSRHSRDGTVSDCFSLDHPFHQQLYNHVKEQAAAVRSAAPPRHGSFHVDFPEPDPEDVKIAETIESELQRLGNQNEVSHF